MMMVFGSNEPTFAATLLLLLTSMLLLSVTTMVEGQHHHQFLQKKEHVNLRRLAAPTGAPSTAPSVSAAPSAAPTVDPIEPVLLLQAGKFAILTKSGVTTTGVTSVTGDIGASPIAVTSYTGFGSLTIGAAFSTSGLVVGNIYGANHAIPTPAMLTAAVGAMETAYTLAAGRVGPDYVEYGAGAIDGFTLEQGLYKWGTGVGITSSLTFDGPENAVWILQVAGGVTIGNGAIMSITGGAKAENIFWQVAGQTTFGTTSQNKGVFLCKTAIVFNTGSSLDGAALAQTAVTLGAATIVKKSFCDTTASYPC